MADQNSSSPSSSSSSCDLIEENKISNNNYETLIPNLPNDVALQCIARVPRSHHPHLSLVSKLWRFTLQSPHLHSTRRLLNAVDSLLFLNLRLFNPQNSTFSFKWYFLDPSIKNIHSSENTPDPPRIFPIYPCPSHPIGASYVNLDHLIYVIGGSIHDIPSNNVWVYDCLLNKWDLGPKMRVSREFAASGVIDGKIYVLGGCLGDNWARSMNWAEVFDPKTRVWAPVTSPAEFREKWMHGSAVVGGRVYGMADRGGVVFRPETGEWGPVSAELDLGWRGRAAVVDEVLYCYDYLGKVRGFDVGENAWKELRGVNDDIGSGGLPRFLCGATMANVGGKLVVVWEGSGGDGRKEIEVWCAEIAVRKDDESGDLWGSILWSNVIVVVPKGSSIVHCLGVQV